MNFFELCEQNRILTGNFDPNGYFGIAVFPLFIKGFWFVNKLLIYFLWQ